MNKKHEAILVILLFVGAMVVSAVFWSVLPAGYRENQSSDYENVYEPVARSIAAGQGITLNGELATRYPPGFSVLLAGVFELSDIIGLSEDTGMLLFRLVSAGLSVVMVYSMGRLIWSPRMALLPALAWMTYPFFLWLTKQPNSEVPFIPILLAAVFLFWLAVLRKPGSWWLYLLAGLLTGAAMMIRPAAIGLGIVMVLLVFINRRDETALNNRILAAALILTGNFLAVLPWELTVYNQTGSLIPLSSGGAVTIQDGLTFLAVPKEYRREVQIPDDVAELMWVFNERRPEMQSSSGAVAVMVEEARRQPLVFFKLMGIKMARSWYGIDSRNFERPTILLQIGYLGLILWGSLYALRKGGDTARLIAGNWVIVFYFWAMTILVIPLFRYMLPVMGLLMIALPGVVLSVQARRRSSSLPIQQPAKSDY